MTSLPLVLKKNPGARDLHTSQVIPQLTPWYLDSNDDLNDTTCCHDVEITFPHSHKKGSWLFGLQAPPYIVHVHKVVERLVNFKMVLKLDYC